MSDTKTPADAARERAEQRFRLSEERRSDAEKVMSDLNAAKVAEREKTARLRALRLAKEEQDQLAKAEVAAKPRVARVRRAKSSA
ncbi:hypothetical protein [Lichenifustis flavocetrariae]|uniref:Uncharacterized protein n=1 Tax=Lichenifustis flavocetrariae TaxID=2949735 RepID=A0AA41YX63_9HYPH|nr:hypothetical protein [Lichenifustis flavocetrariae]MCW6510221.1 hypothetical protein [Lichenifustis flavocetrariae]